MDFSNLTDVIGILAIASGLILAVIVFNAGFISRDDRFKYSMIAVLMAFCALLLLVLNNSFAKVLLGVLLVYLSVKSFRDYLRFGRVGHFAHKLTRKETNILTGLTEAVIELDMSQKGLITIKKSRSKDLKVFINSFSREQRKIGYETAHETENHYTTENLKMYVLQSYDDLSEDMKNRL